MSEVRQSDVDPLASVRPPTMRTWERDWPDCLRCGGKIDPQIRTGMHFHQGDCISELRRQRNVLLDREANGA